MNHITLKTLRVSMLLVGASLYLGGCGPENLDDPSYLAQLEDAGIAAADDETKKDDAGQDNMAMQGQAMAAPANIGQPVVAGAPVVAAVPPIPVVQLPDIHVKLPTRVAPQPPVLTHSAEGRAIVQNRFHHRDILVPKPHVNTHNIHTTTTINNKFQDRIIDQPSFRNVITASASGGMTTEVLPTLHVTAPPVNFGTAVIPGPGPGPIGVRPLCNRYFSGGFYRYCGPARPFGPF